MSEKIEEFNIRPGMTCWKDKSERYKNDYRRWEQKKDKKINTINIIDKTALIVIVASYNTFIELAEMIKDVLINRLNFIKVDIVDVSGSCKLPPTYSLNFVIKAFRNFDPNTLSNRRILFQTEECWNDRSRGTYRGNLIQGYTRTFEMYDENVKLKNTESVVYCPIGYSSVWERNFDKVVDEDIDVFFHGSLTDRRKKFLTELTNRGYKVFAASNLFGEERDKTILRSKITINIKANDLWSFGPLHCLPAMANKKFLLTEKANGGYGPFKPQVHFKEYNGLMGRWGLIEAVKYWIDAGKEERDKFALSAYNDMVKTCNFSDILVTALKNVGE